ncbi:MAG: peptidoglycan editing factor PgeF [Acidobacteriota bacterium]
MLKAPNLSAIGWLTHGFGQRDSVYPPAILTIRQIHSDIVVEAGDGTAEGDAIVSNEAGVVAGIRTADCVPVLLADTRTRAVACVHAGWRGSARNIVAAAVQELISRYGSRPEDLSAAVGPSIGVCCYEVGPDVARNFGSWIPGAEKTVQPVHLDLAAVNEYQLRAAGVRDVWKAGRCTFCEADGYFSFRREREQAGRMVSYIGILVPAETGGAETRRADRTGFSLTGPAKSA